MKILRLLILALYIGPMLGLTFDACCPPDAIHSEMVTASDQQNMYFQAADDCCDESDCADCTLCHSPSFSALAPHIRSQLLAQHRHAQSEYNAFAEITGVVPTPPPTY